MEIRVEVKSRLAIATAHGYEQQSSITGNNEVTNVHQITFHPTEARMENSCIT